MHLLDLKPVEQDILSLLRRQGNGWVPVRTIHEWLKPQFGASAATTKLIQRALRRLADQGAVEEEGLSSGKKWRLSASKTIIPSPVTNIDLAVALLQLEKYAGNHLPADALNSLHAHCESARDLLNRNPHYLRNSFGRAWAKKTALIDSGFPLIAPVPDKKIMTTLTDALYNGVKITLSYRNAQLTTQAPESYEVSPLALIERGRILYLVSCRKSRRGKIYRRYLHRIDRIIDASITYSPSDVDPDFELDSFIASEHALLFFPEPPEAVTLWIVEQGFRSILRDYRLSADQIITEAAGGFYLTATVRPSLTFKQFLLGICSQAQVISPARLRNEIAATIEHAFNSYRRPHAPHGPANH